MTNDIGGIAERLASSESGLENWLWIPLLRLLAQGEPVGFEDLAAATGGSAEEVRQALAAIPDVEYDHAGRVIGLGLTQQPTPHRFAINGQQLYTWCALDTLIFPSLIGLPARVESTYGEAGRPVNVEIGPDGVSHVDPPDAVVSLVNPEDMSSVRSAFCNQVHFFASADEAVPWLENHPGGAVVPVAEGYRLAAAMTEKMLQEGPAQAGAGPEGGASGCC
jgi:alkylmercury lyase